MIRRAASYARRRVRRAGKALRQRLGPAAPETAALFVVGAQRSGTTMLMDVLERLPETRVYQEYDRAAFAPDWRLRPLAVRRWLVARARCRWVAFKPLFDFQHLDRLLEEHPGSRAIFVLRRHRDVSLSSAEKWGDALRAAVRRLATEDPCAHWMADRLPAERKARLAACFREDLPLTSVAALRWYLRNEIFFDLDLAARPERVLPIRYEELVGAPRAAFARIFDFLELPPRPEAIADVDRRSLHRAGDLALDPAVAALCEDLESRLDAVIARRETAA